VASNVNNVRIISFKICFIPAEESKNVEDWTLEIPENDEDSVMAVINKVKPHFNRTGSNVSKEDYKEMLKKSLEANPQAVMIFSFVI